MKRYLPIEYNDEKGETLAVVMGCKIGWVIVFRDRTDGPYKDRESACKEAARVLSESVQP